MKNFDIIHFMEYVQTTDISEISRGYRRLTANKCSAIASGFATFASAKPPANVIYSQHVMRNKPGYNNKLNSICYYS